VRRQVAASQDDEGTAVELPLPDVGSWSRTLASGPLVAAPDRAHDDPLRPLVWDGVRLYLQRYWSFELAVAEQIIVRSASAPDGVDGVRPSHVDAALEAVFPAEAPDEPDLQRLAARRALIHPVARARARPTPSPGSSPPRCSCPRHGASRPASPWPRPPAKLPDA
jgi:hypothetical protein